MAYYCDSYYRDTHGAYAWLFVPYQRCIHGLRAERVRGFRETRNAFGCKNDEAKWTHRQCNAQSSRYRSQGNVLPSSGGMNIVRTHTISALAFLLSCCVYALALV